MVSIDWCLKQKDGIKLIEQNKNIADSYLKMAEESIKQLENVKKSKIWTATITYYTFYYSLYSLMRYIGVKCEIHTCSLEFIKVYLDEFYNKKDIEMFEKAFSARINLQYYADRPVDESEIRDTKIYCKDFYIKTKDILTKISEIEINKIRDRIKKSKNANTRYR
ncbi:MAG TPA: hypothetical protein VJB94_01740 [Candidatus Nanoarchaeia archaeon]|nr:hypothetical protein [Candidatus Nanoarchaeia archaeon]